MKTITLSDQINTPAIREQVMKIIAENPDSLTAIPKVKELIRHLFSNDCSAHRAAHFLHYELKYP